MYAEYQNNKINIIDTPGLDDFNGQVVGGLSVSDSSLLLINSQQGIEVGTELACRITDRGHKPMIIVINQLEHEKANFDKCIDDLKSKFGTKAIITQYPVETGLDSKLLLIYLNETL